MIDTECIKDVLNSYQKDVEFKIDVSKAISDFTKDHESSGFGVKHDAYDFFDQYQFKQIKV